MREEQIYWFLHMDKLLMYRVHLPLSDGKSLAMSQGYFHLEDANRALAEAVQLEAHLALNAQ